MCTSREQGPRRATCFAGTEARAGNRAPSSHPLGGRGIGLIETLVGGAIGAVVVAGSMKSLQLSLESAQVVKSSLSESDLRFSIGQTLHNTSDCVTNFAPTSATVPTDPEQASSIGLYGTNRDFGRGEVVRLAKTLGTTDTADDIPILKKGVAFKGALNIVKMELKGAGDTGDANNPKKNKVSRTFVVYYKKEGMGSYSTLGGEPCTATDQSGCYFNQCQVEYQLDDDDNTATPFTKVCRVSDCANYGSQGRGANCYKVDGDSGKERTLVGCGADSAEGLQTVAIGFSAGKVNTGNYNTFLGAKAGGKNTSAPANTFVGQAAGQENTAGRDNTFVGTASGRHNTTASHNTFLGYYAGEKNTTGQYNTFVGRNAGGKNTTAYRNTFIGEAAGRDNTTGGGNTFVGTGAGILNTTAGRNTFIGRAAGEKNTTGKYNTFVGAEAGKSNTTSYRNTFIGEAAGRVNTTGANNTFVGTGAGYLNTTAGDNTFIGQAAGEQVTTAGGNTFIGKDAGQQTTANDPNTGYGEGTGNVFVGIGAGLRNTTGAENTIIGAYAGLQNSSQTMTGSNNLFLGNRAGYSTTTGRGNIFIGNDAGKQVTTGVDNVYIGNNVGDKSNMQGINNLTNISNRLLMKRSTRTLSELGFHDSEIRVLGTLKVCSQTNTNCKNVVLPQLCPTGQVLRGFNNDGTKNCQTPSPTITIRNHTFSRSSGEGTSRAGTYDFCALSTAEKTNDYCKHHSVGHSCHLTRSGRVWSVKVYAHCGNVRCDVHCFNFN